MLRHGCCGLKIFEFPSFSYGHEEHDEHEEQNLQNGFWDLEFGSIWLKGRTNQEYFQTPNESTNLFVQFLSGFKLIRKLLGNVKRTNRVMINTCVVFVKGPLMPMS